MGVAYTHSFLTDRKGTLNVKEMKCFIKQLSENGIVKDEKIQITPNPYLEKETSTITKEYSISDFINNILPEDTLDEYTLYLPIDENTNPVRIPQMFKVESFDYDTEKDGIYTYLQIASSKYPLLPDFYGSLGGEAFDSKGNSINGEWERFYKEGEKVMVYRTKSFIQVTEPLDMNTKVTIKYPSASDRKEQIIEFTPSNIGISFDFGSCLPLKDSLISTGLIENLLSKCSINVITEFPLWG